MSTEFGKLTHHTGIKDAIHIACISVKAAHYMYPCATVTVDENMVARNAKLGAIGIVDPFLRTRINEGDTFWVFLFPGTITSLRHEWEHPHFKNIKIVNETDISRSWLEKFAYDKGLTYEMLVENNFVGDDSSFNEDMSEEFKYHFRKVTGCIEMPYFRCAC